MRNGARFAAGCVTAASAALLLSACASISQPHPITGVTWKLAAINSSGSSTRLRPDLRERHTITFDNDGRASMQLDCNRGTASWNASMPDDDSGALSLGPVASTRALCPDPSFGEMMASELPSAESFTLRNEQSVLVVRTDRLRFRFEAE